MTVIYIYIYGRNLSILKSNGGGWKRKSCMVGQERERDVLTLLGKVLGINFYFLPKRMWRKNKTKNIFPDEEVRIK